MTKVIEVKKAAAASFPNDIQTFSGEADRRRLSPAAIKAFQRVMQNWDLSNAQASALLGVSPSTWDRIKSGKWDQPLSQDQLTRVSAIVGVLKGLRLLFVDDMASKWPKLSNRGPIFRSRSPIDAMIEDGIPTMLETRRLIDSVRGGL